MKNMLQSILIGCILLACAAGATPCRLHIAIDRVDNQPKYAYGSEIVTKERLVEILNKIGKRGSYLTVLLVPSDRVSVSDLFDLLLTIRESGFRNVIISVQGKRNGVDGNITFGMDMFQESFTEEILLGSKIGFETSVWEFIKDIEIPDAGKKTNSVDKAFSNQTSQVIGAAVPQQAR